MPNTIMKIHKEIQKVYKQLVLEKLMFLCKFSVEFALQHNIWGGKVLISHLSGSRIRVP